MLHPTKHAFDSVKKSVHPIYTFKKATPLQLIYKNVHVIDVFEKYQACLLYLWVLKIHVLKFPLRFVVS